MNKPDVINIGLEDDLALGALVADAKIVAMRQGFDVRYQDGVTSFLAQQGNLLPDELLGRELAAAIIEERRKTMVAIAVKASVFSAISIGAAVLSGLALTQSAAFAVPSTVAAVCCTRRLNG